VVFEQRERRRIRAVFGSIIAPEVVNELLSVEQLSLGGARKVLTVLFSDIRGFTEFTDSSQAAAEEYVRTHNLSGPEAEAWLAEQAREALATVNLYLGIVANTIKRHRGTLDKYIGDCVMAFWGAPVANQTHAIACVRAAIEAQRAIDTLNQERRAENSRRNQENERRLSEGVTQLPLLPLLSLGTGINTGAMTVGLMGSREHLLNYTVFGREVNLACRLESISGRARIIVSEATHREIAIHDPDLARSCVELPPVQVKGIRLPVRNFEVPWRVTPPGDQGQLDAKVTETVSASSRISDAQGRLD
jgi:adenylate cyclase